MGLKPLHSCGGWKSEASGWPGWSFWGCETYSVPGLSPWFTDAHLPSVCLLRDPLWWLPILVTFRKMLSTNAAIFWGPGDWGLRSWGQETTRPLQPLFSHLEHGAYHGMQLNHSRQTWWELLCLLLPVTVGQPCKWGWLYHCHYWEMWRRALSTMPGWERRHVSILSVVGSLPPCFLWKQ